MVARGGGPSTCLEAVDEAQKQCLLHLANPSEVAQLMLRARIREGSGMLGRFRLTKTNGAPRSRWRGACEPQRLHCAARP